MEKEVNKKSADSNQDEVKEKVENQEVVTETKHNNNKVLVIVLVVIGAFVLLGIAGTILAGKIFKKAGESIVENATNTKITTDKDGNTTIQSNDGSSTTSTEQKLPDNFPKTIPLYANQKITGSYKQKTAAGNYWQVNTETEDSVAKVVASVKDAYSKSPWTSDSEVESDGSFSLSYSKPSFKVTVYVSQSSDMKKTSITYSVSEETATE